MKRSISFVMLALGLAIFAMGCGDSANSVALDTTPPLAPVMEGANKADGAIAVWWQPNAEADLDGYNVYVIENGVTDQVNLHPVDESYYAIPTDGNHNVQVYVTAVDFSGNESSPSSTRNVGIDVDTDFDARDIIDGRPIQK